MEKSYVSPIIQRELERQYVDGIKLFDTRNSNSFENLDLSKGEEVDREKQLTKIDKIRIAERTRNSIYGDGIKKILGFEMEKDQKRSEFQK